MGFEARNRLTGDVGDVGPGVADTGMLPGTLSGTGRRFGARGGATVAAPVADPVPAPLAVPPVAGPAERRRVGGGDV